jgi:uncharacterized OB-fold protein
MADQLKQRPVPIPDAESQPYWDAAAEHVLKLPYCGSCKRFMFPPRPACPACLDSTVTWTELSGRGTLHSFAVMHDSYVTGFDPPFLIAQIELAEQPGLRLTTNLVDCAPKDAVIGMSVSVIFEERADGVTVPQFRPTGVAT